MKKLRFSAIIFSALFFCSCTGLLYNSKIGNVDGIRKALESGVPIDTRNQADRTALMIATYNKQPEAVEYLCSMGANINAQDRSGCTALLYASYYNILEVAKILIKYDADITIKDRYGNTPLDYAEENEYLRMIAVLKGSKE